MDTYYILGSGPVGVIVAKYLINLKFNVVIIDNSKQKNNEFRNNKFLLKKTKNIFSENLHAYKKSKPVLPVSSEAIGGFSEIWGGVVEFLEDYELQNWPIMYDDLKNYYNFILKNVDINSLKINSRNEIENFLEVDETFYMMLDKFKTNKFKIEKNKININLSKLFIKNKKIWSAKDTLNQIKKLYPNQIKHIQNFEVTNLKEGKNFIELSNRKESIKIENSKLFVAAGSFTSSVLASKIVNINEFKIQDSELNVMPLLWLGKTSLVKNRNTYPQLNISFKLENNTLIRTQLYGLSENLLTSLNLNILILKILKFLSWMFKNRIYILFIYSNSSNSSHNIFKIKNNYVEAIKKVSKKSNVVRSIYLKFLKVVKYTFLIPIPIIKKFPMYGSFHHGASFPISNDSNNMTSVNLNGQLTKDSNIHFLDSSVFCEIPSGPITLSSMALALFIVNGTVS